MLRGWLGNLASPLNGGGAVIGREKRVLLRHYLEEGISKAEIARHLKISRRTVYNSGSKRGSWTEGRAARR